MIRSFFNMLVRPFRRNNPKVTSVSVVHKAPEPVVLPVVSAPAKAKVVAKPAPKLKVMKTCVPYAGRVLTIFGRRKNRARVVTSSGDMRTYKILDRRENGMVLVLQRKGHPNGRVFTRTAVGAVIKALAA